MENGKISIEEWRRLAEKGNVLPITISLHGKSMEPLIRQGKDQIDISPLSGTPHLFDVIVFRQGSRWCAHRVYRTAKGGVYTMGDNVRRGDGFVKNEDIAGVAAFLRRDGRVIPLCSGKMRLYGAVRVALFPFRLAVKKLIAAAWHFYCRAFKKGGR